MNIERSEDITWEAPEYAHTKKDSEWYWSIGILTLAGVASAYMFGNFLLAVLVFLIGFSMALFSARKPKIISFGISRLGIRADNTLYPFQTLQSFWIVEKKHENLILLRSRKKLSMEISIPLGNTDPEPVRMFLLDHLMEEEDVESVAQRFMDFLGF